MYQDQPNIRDFETGHAPTDYTKKIIRTSQDGKTAIVGYLTYDHDPENPRTNFDCMGTFAVHRQSEARLADPHSYEDEIKEFIFDLVRKANPAAGEKIEYWQDEQNPFFHELSEARDWDAIEEIQEKITTQIAEEALTETVIVSVNIYTQSYNTISWSELQSTCDINTKADAHIYVLPEKIIQEYGENTPETRKQAQAHLYGELETFKEYLGGDVYGMIVERHIINEDEEWELDEELENVWGFYGQKWAEEELETTVNSYWEETTEPEPTPAEYAKAA